LTTCLALVCVGWAQNDRHCDEQGVPVVAVEALLVNEDVGEATLASAAMGAIIEYFNDNSSCGRNLLQRRNPRRWLVL